jgi:hypothetical protein
LSFRKLDPAVQGGLRSGTPIERQGSCVTTQRRRPGSIAFRVAFQSGIQNRHFEPGDINLPPG